MSTPPFTPHSVTSLPSSPSSAFIFRWVSTDGRRMSTGLPAGLISAGTAGKLWQIDVRAHCRCSRFWDDRLHLKDLGRVPANEFYKNRLASIDRIGWRELIFFVTIQCNGRHLNWWKVFVFFSCDSWFDFNFQLQAHSDRAKEPQVSDLFPLCWI